MSKEAKLITTQARSKLMASVRQSGTSVEISVRSIFSELDAEYDMNVRGLPGTPDLASYIEKGAVFVHGCFWHAHPDCKRWTMPKRNRLFWKRKFLNNRRRDIEKIRELEELGYSVLVVWECELERRENLKHKISEFLATSRLLSNSVNKTSGTNSAECKTLQYSGATVTFRYSRSGEHVLRVVRLANGRRVTTRIGLKGINVNGLNPQAAFDYVFLRLDRRPKTSRRRQIVRVVDLFSGCGGLSLGAMEASRAAGKRFTAVAAIDNDASALQVYQRNFRDAHTYLGDINDFLDGGIGSDPTDNELDFILNVGETDILLAGPPCQGHSDLNNHTRRDDDRNILYERVARFVELSRPEHILIENVPTVIHGKRRSVQRSVSAIEDLGYSVQSGTVSLAAIGVPQQRKRHVVVASLTKNIDIDDVIERHRTESVRSVMWAIGDLENTDCDGVFDMPSKHTEENMRRIRYLHENDLYNLPNKLRPRCHRHGRHSYKSMYGRMKADEPAQTVTSGFGSPGQGRYIHPTQLRTITPHEASRLQFFPDFFDFSQVRHRTRLARMIGNAAPMKLSYVFCLEMLT